MKERWLDGKKLTERKGEGRARRSFGKKQGGKVGEREGEYSDPSLTQRREHVCAHKQYRMEERWKSRFEFSAIRENR